jgi:protease-4
MSKHPILYSFLAVLFVVVFLSVVLVLTVAVSGSSDRSSFFGFGQIAVVNIEGTILESVGILRELRRHAESDSIKAIVLRIDSPGGAVAPSQELYAEIRKIRKKDNKKVVVSMGSLAASGGYYIACAADIILAQPGTITGSIGVLMENFGFHELVKMARIENRVIKSGRYKDVGSPFRSITEDEKKYLKAILDNMYNQFKKAVAAERGLTAKKISQLAEGKIYTGEQAVKAGLIDRLGTLYDAIDEARKLAHLPEGARVVWPKEKHHPWEWFVAPDAYRHSFKRMTRELLYSLKVPVWMYTLSYESTK